MKKIIYLLIFVFFGHFGNAQVTITFPSLDSANRALAKGTATLIPGPKGDPGYTPVKGKDYFDGKDGKTGAIGPQGPQGLPGKDASETGGTAQQLFSIKSIKDFGADPSLEDNTEAINRCFKYCIDNNIRVAFIPVGRYKFAGSLIIMKPNGFVTLEVLGESSFWDSNLGSVLQYTGPYGFAIGIQNGKGCKIRKVTINGIFQPPFSGDRKKFFASKFEDFKDGVCRDNRYSPHAAIVIDPFTNIPGQLPEDGGYPGLTSYYGTSPGLSTNTGSTGIELEDISINNFVVGIISSPNGFTRNAEISIFHKIQFENMKLCIANCQDQEKGNVIDGIYCWGNSHTIFANTYYGSGGRMAGNYNIDHANIAGAVVRFIYNQQFGYFPTYVAHVFAESLGEWGTINSELATSISDCHVDFAAPYEGNDTSRVFITSYGENVVYRSCNFRLYDGIDTHIFNVAGNAFFDHCYFNGTIKRR